MFANNKVFWILLAIYLLLFWVFIVIIFTESKNWEKYKKSLKKKKTEYTILDYLKYKKISVSEAFILLSLLWSVLGFIFQATHLLYIEIPLYPYFDMSSLLNNSVVAFLIFLLWGGIIYNGKESYYTITDIAKKVFKIKNNKYNKYKKYILAIFIIIWISLFIHVSYTLIKNYSLIIKYEDGSKYPVYYLNNAYVMYYIPVSFGKDRIIIRDRNSNDIRNASFLWEKKF